MKFLQKTKKGDNNMKKRIIIGDAPRLGKKDFHVGLVTMDDYETSNETYSGTAIA